MNKELIKYLKERWEAIRFNAIANGALNTPIENAYYDGQISIIEELNEKFKLGVFDEK